ncbi:MAG TPA: hypothetical protein VMV07_02410 [Streptosporangiaceae bacterium]|nr:hypothetical protein [Streptosporangiaceae bacterium]
MSAPSKTEPPYVPIRTGGWPGGWRARRSPRWLIPAGALLLAIAVAVGLTHRPSNQERASDLRGLLAAVNYDIESCAGGVRESLQVLQAVDSGSSHDAAAAASIANTGSANCSPANNELIDDLESYQVPESLASFHLQLAVTGLIDWAAPDAVQVQADVATVLAARGTPAQAADRAALRRDLAKLDAQRAQIRAALGPAIGSLSPHTAEPVLPG